MYFLSLMSFKSSCFTSKIKTLMCEKVKKQKRCHNKRDALSEYVLFQRKKRSARNRIFREGSLRGNYWKNRQVMDGWDVGEQLSAKGVSSPWLQRTALMELIVFYKVQHRIDTHLNKTMWENAENTQGHLTCMCRRMGRDRLVWEFQLWPCQL